MSSVLKECHGLRTSTLFREVSVAQPLFFLFAVLFTNSQAFCPFLLESLHYPSLLD